MVIRCLHLIGPLLLFLLCNAGERVGATYPGYRITQQNQVPTGITANLALNGAGPYGSDIATPAVSVTYQTSSILRIKVYDPSNSRWEVPNVNQLSPPTSAPSNLDYKVELQSNPFGFSISRVSDADVIFNTIDPSFNPLLFSDQYLELSTTLPDSPNIYGLGERITNFRLPLNNNYTIWNLDEGTPTMKNLYGTHPFYLEMRPSGNAHGVFILNSNAQNWELTSNSLTYRTIGGIFDIFVFLGPSPAEVVQQYHSVIGYPHFPPYWGLGWHQCRWGYTDLQETMDVVANYAKYGIPLDTMWNDIDYMDQYRDFTNDPVNYPQAEVRAFVEQLHANGQHYIMIIDPGISIDPGYPAYDELMESNAYLRTYNSSTPIQGKVWPGLVYFPDFFHPNATDYWYNQVSAFHAAGPEFDGMWIDMNEISNFCTGQCPTETRARHVRATAASYDNPPYLPTNGVILDHNTVNVTAEQYIGIMYNTHNMYGWSEGVASKLALEKLRGTRSVVISRSTFAGTGHHNGHWLGDNDSTWTSMYESIAGVLSMQLFGVNLVGADICGFGGNTTAQLCARWMQLGSLYPFSRNHNSVGQTPQEPYAFGEPLISISIFALKTRYSLLPYYYTLFQAAHTNATTVWRPLFFEFPTDVNTYGIDEQFMVGPYLLASPVLVENATSVNAYFPQGIWYCLYEGVPISSNGEYQNISAPLEIIRIHVRGGGIVPTQVPALTTAATRNNDFGLLVALDKNGNAAGTLYLDDGESLDPITETTYVTFAATPYQGTGGQVSNSVISSSFQAPPLGSITVYGVQQAPTKVVIQNSPVTFIYNTTTQVLYISPMNVSMTSNFVLNWL